MYHGALKIDCVVLHLLHIIHKMIITFTEKVWHVWGTHMYQLHAHLIAHNSDMRANSSRSALWSLPWKISKFSCNSIIILYFTNSAKKDSFMSIKMYHMHACTGKEHADDRLSYNYRAREDEFWKQSYQFNKLRLVSVYSVVWNQLSLWDLSRLFWGYNCAG